ncbi:hypothetical protein ACFS07_05745 [Undibacterium arcticum]
MPKKEKKKVSSSAAISINTEHRPFDLIEASVQKNLPGSDISVNIAITSKMEVAMGAASRSSVPVCGHVACRGDAPAADGRLRE